MLVPELEELYSKISVPVVVNKSGLESSLETTFSLSWSWTQFTQTCYTFGHFLQIIETLYTVVARLIIFKILFEAYFSDSWLIIKTVKKFNCYILCDFVLCSFSLCF